MGRVLAKGDQRPLLLRVTVRYRPHVSQAYKYRRGDRVMIVSGSHKGATGTVESLVFQRTVDHPDESAAGYHVVLEDVRIVTVRWDQVATRSYPNPLKNASQPGTSGGGKKS